METEEFHVHSVQVWEDEDNDCHLHRPPSSKLQQFYLREELLDMMMISPDLPKALGSNHH